MEKENASVVGKFLDPKSIIKQANLTTGSIIADFGCGPGYFSIPVAQQIGELGKVYSLDILPQALETVEGKRKNLGIANIVTKRANLEKDNGSKLESCSVDYVILKDILFQNKNKELIIGEAYRILKSGGKAIIVEWNQKNAGIGPDMDIRVPQDGLEKLLLAKDFILEKEIDAGDFHYALLVTKK